MEWISKYDNLTNYLNVFKNAEFKSLELKAKLILDGSDYFGKIEIEKLAKTKYRRAKEKISELCELEWAEIKNRYNAKI